MITTIKNILLVLMALPVLSFGVLAVVPQTAWAGPAAAPDGACAQNTVNISEGVDCARGDGTKETLFGGNNSLFKTVTNVLLFLIGAISVIMLIIGGFRYVVSNGDSTQVTNAKNTILYAVIGIIVALLAYAIVNFVVDSFIAKPADAGGNQRTE